MDILSLLPLLQTALELGLICSITVLALFLSYSMLNDCDLSTDGCFTLGAAVGAAVAISGHPYLSLPAAMLAGMLSGLVTAILQTRMGVNSLLSGIIVNTALYSVNIAVMGRASVLNINRNPTVFSLLQNALKKSSLPFLKAMAPYSKLLIALMAVILIIVFLSFFLRIRMGLAIRATGDNADMVRSSSINPVLTTTVGLVVANAFTGLSGCLLAQYNKSASIDIGSGMVTVALASLLIGNVFIRRGGVTLMAIAAVLGSIVFRVVYTVALQLDMPSFMLKAVSSIIVVIAISGPYLQQQIPVILRKMGIRTPKEGKKHA